MMQARKANVHYHCPLACLASGLHWLAPLLQCCNAVLQWRCGRAAARSHPSVHHL